MNSRESFLNSASINRAALCRSGVKFPRPPRLSAAKTLMILSTSLRSIESFCEKQHFEIKKQKTKEIKRLMLIERFRFYSRWLVLATDDGCRTQRNGPDDPGHV